MNPLVICIQYLQQNMKALAQTAFPEIGYAYLHCVNHTGRLAPVIVSYANHFFEGSKGIAKNDPISEVAHVAIIVNPLLLYGS